MMLNNNKLSLHTEKEIKSLKGDKLNRARFVNIWASALAEWKDDESGLIVGWQGNWGIGKSSIKNMVIEVLTAPKGEVLYDKEFRIEGKGLPKNHVLEFNPWQWADHEQVHQELFASLCRVFTLSPRANKVSPRKYWRAFRRRVNWISISQKLVKTNTFMEFLASPFTLSSGALLGIYLLLSETAFLHLLSIMLVALVFSWSIKVALSVIHLFKDPGINELHNSMRKKLKGIEHPIIIFIDDIDRLAASEINLIIQTVKANMSFPNTVFVLLYQRENVEDALNGITGSKGSDYLKKIIQIPVDVPRNSFEELRDLLIAELNNLLDGTELDNETRERFENLQTLDLSTIFRNVRDIERLLASYKLQLGTLMDKEGGLNVNPYDLLILECLRIGEPGVYDTIFRSKSLLVNTIGGMMATGVYSEEGRLLEIQTILDPRMSTNFSQHTFRRILCDLFPNSQKAWENAQASASVPKESHKRVYETDYFDRYFQQRIADYDLSQQQILSLFNSLGNIKHFVEQTLITAHLEDGNKRLCFIFERLRDNIDRLESRYIENLLLGLSEITSKLSKADLDIFLVYNPKRYCLRLAESALLTLDKSERTPIIQNVINKLNYISLMATLINLLGSKEGNSEFIDSDDLIALRRSCLIRIESLAKSGQLAEEPELYQLLWLWEEWKEILDNFNPRSWLNSMVNNHKAALNYLNSCVGLTYKNGGGYVTMSLERAHKYIDREILDNALEGISASNSPEFYGLLAYQDAINNNKEQGVYKIP